MQVRPSFMLSWGIPRLTDPAADPEQCMSIWKQLLASIILLVLAAFLWLRFFPGAADTLESWGLDWAIAAVPARPTAEAPTASRTGGFGNATALVATAPVAQATINDRLTAIGTGRALSSVSVTPFASGRLVEVLVASGALVEAGSVIAKLDSDSEQIAVDRARIALEDALARLERIEALRSSNTATTVQVKEAQLDVENARLALRDAELELERRIITAPISGFVGIMPVSAGNYVTPQSEIATIDDRSRIVVDYWVPERFAGMVEVGQPIAATSAARPNQKFAGVVTAVDNRVDAESRTLRVQASIDNADDSLRAGMSFQVTMQFAGDTYPAVDPLAIQWGTDGAFVWVVDNGRARKAQVRIIQRNTDSVLVSGDFGPASSVVTEGIHAVREGGDVEIVRGEPGAAPAGVGAAGS